jgi:uncharacterized protein (UPF0147 family)
LTESELGEMCRAQGARCLEVLEDIRDDPLAPAVARAKASELLADYQWVALRYASRDGVRN